MKALTIWQPWASLIMAGAKPWEWRGWPPPKSLVGQPLVIHAGMHHGNRNDSIRGILKRKILEERLLAYECAICHISEWQGCPITLTLDHIDGHSGNHSKNNLRLLCPNCDSQQSTYCGKNKGRYSLPLPARSGKQHGLQTREGEFNSTPPVPT